MEERNKGEEKGKEEVEGKEMKGDESWKVEKVCDRRGANVSYGTGSHVS